MTTNCETKNIKKTQQKHHLVLTIFLKKYIHKRWKNCLITDQKAFPY